jgi:1-acyl-sn-glycerol-3-phosphate acyltransferase
MLSWPFFLYKRYGNIAYKLSGRTIIISDHYSNFDPFFIYWIYGRNKKIHFVTIVETKKKLWSKFITWLFDCLYIDGATVNMAFFKKAIQILNDDGIICIFPEGYVNHRKYGFLDFKASYVYLARKTQATILPLYIYPQISFFKKSLLYIGDPLETKDYAHLDDRDEASMHIQSRVMNYAVIIDRVLEEKTVGK